MSLSEQAPVSLSEQAPVSLSEQAPVLRMHAWSPKPPSVVECEPAVSSDAADPFVEELEALIEDWGQTPLPQSALQSPMPVEATASGRPEAPTASLPASPRPTASLPASPRPTASLPASPRPTAPATQPLEPLALELTPLPPASSAWLDFTGRLATWLLQAGATRASALLCSLLEGNQVSLQRLSQPARERLLAQGMAEVLEGDTVPTAALLERARRFQHDFMCRSLDESAAVDWLSRVLGGLLAAELDEQEVREALRQCGALRLLTRAA